MTGMFSPRVVSRRVTLLVASLLLLVSTARADEIRVMTSGAFAAAYRELIPEFERATGHKLVTVTTTIGTGSTSIPSRLHRGEVAEVVILPAAALVELAKNGAVVAGSRVDLARSAIGMAVRAGAPKPDIGSVEALKRTLLEATSIAYSGSVSGLYLSEELFPRLGIADEVRGKGRRIEGEPVGEVVARGEAQIGFQQISEILPVPGIDYVGPLPPEVQRVTVLSAGVAASARYPEAARAFISFLSSPERRAVIAKTGLEPVIAR
jgi:molybdate transport system substrate-binding protein